MLAEFLGLLTEPRHELLHIVGVTLTMSLFSTVISCALGMWGGLKLGAARESRAKRLLQKITNTLMGLPPVLAGLFVFLLLSRSGPLGSLKLLFSVAAMVIAQVVLITPVVTALTASVVAARAPALHETAAGFGLTAAKERRLLLGECRKQLYSVAFTAFGRSIAEVGAVSLVGGNVQFKTRVMTTAIMLETNRGNFSLAIALGLFLLLIAFIVNALAYRLGEEK